jgi:transcriptional regulator MraZ
MAGFLGEYEATIDAKGRFLLPGGIKKQMPEGTDTIVISRGLEKCLLLYPMKAWEAIEERLKKLNDFNPKVSEFKTRLLGGATKVELDTAGRILLPPSLKSHAGLVKDITLASDIDKIKIWDSDKYKKLFEEFSSDDFAKLASEVMVNTNV